MNDIIKEKQRLLIVDDSRVVRVTARKILCDHFETIEAVDGENAWELLTGETSFALVVSDLSMPNLDGFGLLERIRSFHLPQIRELPVIIITGANDAEATKQRARATGATDFISKPFDAVHLLARTQTHASSHAACNMLREEKTQLEDQSTVDATTGLGNETAFMERGYQLLSFAIRHNSSLAVFRIEIDDFGDLYREYGDNLTEAVVQAMGQILAKTVRQEDTAARIGPARFALLLPGVDKSGVHNLAERISREFSARTFSAGDKQIQVTASIGIGNPDIRRDTRLGELLSVADQRLAQAISQRGNRIVAHDGSVTPGQETGLPATIKAAEPASAMHPGSDVTPLSTIDMLLAGEAEFEIEEIELTATGFELAHPFTQCEAPTTSNPSPPAPGPLAASFAAHEPADTVAPVRGTSFSAAPVAAETPEMTRLGPPGSPTDAPEGALCETATDNDQEKDAIVISAPFAAHGVIIPGIETTGTSKSADDGEAAQTAVIDPDNPAEDDTPRPRKGFLRKTLGLFGRSRSRD